jgi:hypothetical protein
MANEYNRKLLALAFGGQFNPVENKQGLCTLLGRKFFVLWMGLKHG